VPSPSVHVEGSISAWAEEPVVFRSMVSILGVDLRVGGGTAMRSAASGTMRGRSPRGRRNRKVVTALRKIEGSISAWAEEPEQADPARQGTGVDLRVGGGTEIS